MFAVFLNRIQATKATHPIFCCENMSEFFLGGSEIKLGSPGAGVLLC